MNGGSRTKIESSGDESSEMEFKPRPIVANKQVKPTQLRDIKAPKRKKESIDRGLELREGECLSDAIIVDQLAHC